MRPAVIPYDYEDYAALPNDARRYEVIDGEVDANPAPAPRHQTISRRLQYALMMAQPGLAQVFNAPRLVDPTLGQIELFRLETAEYALHFRLDRASRFTTPSFPQVDVELGHVFR